MSSAVPDPGFIDCHETKALSALTNQYHALEAFKERARMAWSWALLAAKEIETYLTDEIKEKEAASALSEVEANELRERRVKFAYHWHNFCAVQKPLAQAAKDMIKVLNDLAQEGHTKGSPFYCIVLFNLDIGVQLVLQAVEHVQDNAPAPPDYNAEAAVDEKYASGTIFCKIIDTMVSAQAEDCSTCASRSFNFSALFHKAAKCFQMVLSACIKESNTFVSGERLTIPPGDRKFSLLGEMTPVAEFLQQHEWNATAEGNLLHLTWGTSKN